MSGESHMELQRSGSLNHDREENEDEQVLQPKIKRKRSIRVRPRLAVDSLLRVDSFQADRRLHGIGKTQMHNTTQPEQKMVQEKNTYKNDHHLSNSSTSLKAKRTPPANRKIPNKANLHVPGKPTRPNPISTPSDAEHSHSHSEVKVKNGSGPIMTEAIQRRVCISITLTFNNNNDLGQICYVD